MAALPPGLIRAIEKGNALLLLGAGATLGAESTSSKKPLLGTELRDALCDEFLGGDFKDQSLATVGDYAINQTDMFTVQTYIKELFQDLKPATFHDQLSSYPWRAIATLNYDTVIEQAYRKCKGNGPNLIEWISNDDRVLSQRQTASDIHLLKLHGCITRINDSNTPLVLSGDQYVEATKGRENVYAELKQQASEATMVCIGTSLEDSDIRNIMLWLKRNISSPPRGYMIRPGIKPIVSQYWESQRIEAIDQDFSSFISELNSQVSKSVLAIPIPSASSAVFRQLTVTDKTISEQVSLFLDQDVDYVHPNMPSDNIEPLRFYKGFDGGWAGIQQKLDCPRRLVDTILANHLIDSDKPGVYFHLIRAAAGSGKSILLKRIAWDAAEDLDLFCIHLKKGAALDVSAAVELCSSTDKRVHLYVDNAAIYVHELDSLVQEAKHKNLSLTIVACERTSEWNSVSQFYRSDISSDYELYRLNESEVHKLLYLLKKHKSLGSLASKLPEERSSILLKDSNGQLLVVLHEALLGKPFEDIVLDEYHRIAPELAKDIYRTICTLNRTGTPVRAGFISRVHGVSFEKFQKEFFSPLEHLVYCSMGKRGYDYEYYARHAYIAELVFNQVYPDREVLLNDIVRILGYLNISYDSDCQSYQHLISHKTLRSIFTSYEHVSAIYEKAISLFPDNGHVWLHRGLYEMRSESGSHDRAEQYLSKARERKAGDRIVNHASAQLELQRARKAKSFTVREAHRLHADKLLSGGGYRGKNVDEYTLSTRIQLQLERVSDALNDPSGNEGTISEAISEVEGLLTDGLMRFPGDSYLYQNEATLAEMLRDHEKVEVALNKSFEANPRNIGAALRLSKIYRDKGELKKAQEVLDKAVKAKQTDKQLNYRLAQIYIESDTHPEAVEAHLRRSYVPGDNNYNAQYLYARQLFINGKYDDSIKLFEGFTEFRISTELRARVRHPITRMGKELPFGAIVKRIGHQYGFVSVDKIPVDVFMPREAIGAVNHDSLYQGARIQVVVGFNYRGPAIMNLSV